MLAPIYASDRFWSGWIETQWEYGKKNFSTGSEIGELSWGMFVWATLLVAVLGNRQPRTEEWHRSAFAGDGIDAPLIPTQRPGPARSSGGGGYLQRRFRGRSVWQRLWNGLELLTVTVFGVAACASFCLALGVGAWNGMVAAWVIGAFSILCVFTWRAATRATPLTGGRNTRGWYTWR